VPPNSAALVTEEKNAVTIRVGINGFGRIGRNFWRAVHAAQESGRGGRIEIIAANDLTDPATNAHLLKYDTVLGKLDVDVTADGNVIRAGDQEIRIFAERDPAALPWGDLGVDVVIESSGRFTSRDAAAAHLTAGARKVIISAPAKGEDITIVMGVNDDSYDAGRHDVISNASCTTNCVAPMAKVLADSFGIVKGLMTTIHAYTSDQVLKNYLYYSTDPIVSSDIVGTPWSCTFDSPLTMAIGDQVKIVGWYDNEFGYSNRLADLAVLVGSGLPARS